MVETIKINNLTLCHKHGDGFVRSTLPDVCKSPSYPVPYTNVAYCRDLEDGTTTVFSHKGAMNGIKGSRFFPSYADEPGEGGGVTSGVNEHQATWLSWSPNVFMEGRPVTRLTDKMLMNRGNTISAGGYYTGDVQGKDRDVMNKLCKIACKCKDKGRRQNCVEKELMLKNPDPMNGLWPEVLMDYDGDYRVTKAGNPSRQRAVATSEASRVDAVQLTNGDATTIVEMKFKDDDFFGDQEKRLNRIAAANGLKLQVLIVEKQCTCTDDDEEKAPVVVPVAQSQKEEEDDSVLSWVKAHPWKSIGIGVGAVAISACVAGTAGICAGGLAAGGIAAAASN